jgi:benzoate-CoA ligase family protein
MLRLPDRFNACAYFVDRHVHEGRGRRVAIEFAEQKVTYGELAVRTRQVASALRSRFEVRPEERVLIAAFDGPEAIYAFFGAIRIGAVPVPVNTAWRPAEYAYALEDSGAAVAIVSASILPHVRAAASQAGTRLRAVIVIGGAPERLADGSSFDDLLSAAVEDEAEAPTSKDAPAFWLYSSGSTGPPKACVHLQHDMVVSAESYARGVLGITETDRCFSVARLFFAYGLGNAMYFPFAVGATSILCESVGGAARVYAAIERYRPTLFFSVPTNYAMLLAHTRDGTDFDLSSIRLAVSAGEALPATLLERFGYRFGIEILDGIGSTEVLHIFISNRPGAVRPGSSGQVIPGYEAKIVDENGRSVAVGHIGDLMIKGDSTCAGYWNQHERTKDVVQGHWIRTGDKYSVDADGYFWFAGRTDDMLKVGGQWVSPLEVESAIATHSGVRECAVVGWIDEDGLTKPCWYVVPVDAANLTRQFANEVVAHACQRLSHYKRPHWVELALELPKTPTGKIQRYKLREYQRVGSGVTT